ncbi:MAG TPA: hypothetical protein VMP68_28965 [Candidatus Eisenbacteria bacterium]|nr:hypothetical protein [Candidatus Eisenbacteria bacterium]
MPDAIKVYDVSPVLSDMKRKSARMSRREIVQTIYQLQDTLGEDGVINGTDQGIDWLIDHLKDHPVMVKRFLWLAAGWLALVAMAFIYHGLAV